MAAEDDTKPPAFQPPWWMKNPHLQTILPTFTPQKLADHEAILRRVELADGDALAYSLENEPANESPL